MNQAAEARKKATEEYCERVDEILKSHYTNAIQVEPVPVWNSEQDQPEGSLVAV